MDVCWFQNAAKNENNWAAADNKHNQNSIYLFKYMPW